MTAELPTTPEALRRSRDATLYRLVHRAARTETSETLRRIGARGHRGVTPAFANLLANLDSDGTIVSALARRGGVTRQAASQQLIALEALGYVTRDGDPSDGRALLVRQTAKGRRLLFDALDVVAELEQEYASAIGEDIFATLKRNLHALLAQVDPLGALGRD
jgi:DNA-binding MarR family transcriptional regulator